MSLFGPFVLRVDVSVIYGNIIYFFDKNKGRVSVFLDSLDDFVVSRSSFNGFTYNFSSILDDIDMSVSFVLRGEDHVTNTFKQSLFILLFSTGFISFFHLPLILDYNFQSKLSKRNFASSLYFYKKNGFFSESLVNYFFYSGWSHNILNYDFLHVSDIFKVLNINFFNKKNSYLSIDKLLFLNRHYICSIFFNLKNRLSFFYYFYSSRVSTVSDFYFHTYRLNFYNVYLVSYFLFFFSIKFFYIILYYFFLEIKYLDRCRWSVKVIFLIVNSISVIFGVKLPHLYKFFRFIFFGHFISVPIVFILYTIGMDKLLLRMRYFFLFCSN